MLSLLRRIAVDLSPLRASRDYRLLVGGEVVSNLGTQAALVALPYQIFVISHSPALVGLLGLFELGPMVVVSLLGGALADRVDRRRVLAVAQVGVIAAAAALAVAAFGGHPSVLLILILGGFLAGSSALDAVTRSAIIPGVLGPSTCARASPSTTGSTRSPGSSDRPWAAWSSPRVASARRT